MTQFEALVSELAAATGLPLGIDARDACSLTFAPWMKKTFAFSARAASAD